MRVRKTLESQFCAHTKNVQFSSSDLLDQRSLQLINTARIMLVRWPSMVTVHLNPSNLGAQIENQSDTK